MKVLLSIRPEFVEKIICGDKKFEYRKRLFKEDVDSVIVYSTMPVGKIVGEFTIEEIINDSPEKLWLRTYKGSGISKDFFMRYFEDKKEGYALKISNLVVFDEPIDPKRIFENFVAPQSFRYIREDFANVLIS